MQLHLDPPFTPAGLLLTRRRLVVTLVVLLAFLALAAAFANGVLLTWDAPIQQEIESSRTSLMDDVFLTLSRFGSTVVVLAGGLVVAALTWRRCPAVAYAVGAATLGRPLVEFLIKATVDRSRPDYDRLVDGTGPSFPSGHVMAAVALWGLLPAVVALYTSRRDVWWAAVGLACGLIAGIAASRVYLGVHWFSDVTAGVIIGAFFLIGVETLFHRAHARYPCRTRPVPLPVRTGH